jgi:2-methylcitrate dehydratase PrpD
MGIRGLPSALHDVYVDAFGAKGDASQLTEELGAAWAISDGYHKMFACCQYGHATIEATCKILERVSADRIESIHLETHEKAWIMDNPDPATTIAAKFSIQHIAATAAIHGGGGAEAFSSASLGHPDVAALRQKVTTSPYEPLPDWPNDRPTRVTWTLDDGSTLTEEVLSARGGPDLPFTPAEIRAKIYSIVDAPYPAMSAVTDAILELDEALLSRPWRDAVRSMTGT